MKVLFPDTNLFLQCKELTQLKWDEIAGEYDICLLISRPVQDEIDRLKHDGNNRRARRARKATSFFREIIQSQESKIIIRESGPRVEILFSPPITAPYKLPDILDLSRSDDRTIAEAIKYKNIYPDAAIAILTHDTNPILTAKHCNLDFVLIPDNWLLEPEPDANQKKIVELEQRLKELERNYPEIEVLASDKEGELLNSLTIMIEHYQQFTEIQFNKLFIDTQSIYPMANQFDKTGAHGTFGINPAHGVLNITHRYLPPSQQEVERYQKELYPNWLQQVKDFYRNLHHKLEESTRKLAISISIRNKGNVPAENLLLEFILVGGLLFMPPSKNDDKDNENILPKIPTPPLVPRGEWVQKSTIGSIMGMEPPITPYIGNLSMSRKHDRHGFYWKPGRPSFRLLDSWTLECDEFRHRVKPEIFNMILFIPSNNEIESSALKCRITARNLPEPVEYVLPVKVKCTEGNTFDKAQRLLPPFFPQQ